MDMLRYLDIGVFAEHSPTLIKRPDSSERGIPMSGKITPSQLVETAVRLEEASSDFYKQVARISSETRSLFEDLANAEAKHAELYRSFDPDLAFQGGEGVFEYLTYLVDTGPLRNLRESGRLGETPLNLDEAFSAAIQFEKETILFYSGFNQLLSPEAAAINLKIITQEKQHLQKVVSTRARIQTIR
jgi:rubrerythrin